MTCCFVIVPSAESWSTASSSRPDRDAQLERCPALVALRVDVGRADVAAQLARGAHRLVRRLGELVRAGDAQLEEHVDVDRAPGAERRAD